MYTATPEIETDVNTLALHYALPICKELRAASILLATISSVPAFAEALLDSLGQRFGTSSRLGCYTEVVFRGMPDQAKDRPDGLMVLETGGGRSEEPRLNSSH